MYWEQITAWLDKFSDKPIVYITTCVVVGFVFALVILNKTSLGKKALLKLTDLYNVGHKRANETLEKVKEVETLAKDEIKGLKAEYEQKIAVLVSIVNFYEESVFSILEEIPNNKVKARLTQFKEKYQEKKNEITLVIGEIYQDFNLAVENKANEIRSEYESKIEYLENQIKQINLYFNEIKEEIPNGEQGEGNESTEDSNPIEEEIQDN